MRVTGFTDVARARSTARQTTDVQSHVVDTRSVSWFALESGRGPDLVLLHGTGSSTHSWRTLMPLLGEHYRVIALDLPGHGQSVLHDEQALRLDGMAQAVHEALQRLHVRPAALIGHSAGAAVAVQMMLTAPDPDVPVLSLNGAFVPFGGLLGQWFTPLARTLSGSHFIARTIASRASTPGAVERLMASTGSAIDTDFLDGYRRLFSSPAHVRATLGMMARWDLWSLQSDMRNLTSPLVLFYAERDLTVPPQQARATARRLAQAEARTLGALGHLAHEEAATDVAACLLAALRECAAATTSRT